MIVLFRFSLVTVCCSANETIDGATLIVVLRTLAEVDGTALVHNEGRCGPLVIRICTVQELNTVFVQDFVEKDWPAENIVRERRPVEAKRA